MDLLDNYKKAWSNQPEETSKFSTVEIYKLAHSKSSSIVKWIFIVGILELILWSGLNLFIPESFYKTYKDLNLMEFVNVFSVLHYIVILIFLYLFYKNYKKVTATNNTKKLIRDILKVRKTVKYYVLYNLGIVFLISVVMNSVMFSDEDKLMKVMNPNNLAMDIHHLVSITIISQIIALLIILVLLWCFYKLVYGILLKKLNRNYKELTKLDNSIN